MEFQKLMAPSLKEMFIKELEGMILSGKLKVGEKLPSERELSLTMQVSRGVVNNGIVELSRKGFLQIRPRVGTFVADYRRTGNLETLISIVNYNRGVLRSEEIRSILEIRLALSELVLTLVIPKITDNELLVLKNHLDGIKNASSNKEAGEMAFHFHHELAVISGNILMPLLYHSFREVVLSLWERFCSLHGIPVLYENTSKLYEQISNKDLERSLIINHAVIYNTINGESQIYY